MRMRCRKAGDRQTIAGDENGSRVKIIPIVHRYRRPFSSTDPEDL